MKLLYVWIEEFRNEEYVFPLSEADPIPSAQAENTTKLISIYQDHREETWL